ncbi:MAG: lipid A deacylase LpxR family protein [Undibacterium sp.]|nr:lipid A deacylase LpxR family protein [Undibacterium sp.]
MIQLIRRLTFIHLVCMMAGNVLAQNALPSIEEFRQVGASGVSVLHLTIDNDSLLMNKDDGFYTSGVQVSSRRVLNTAQQSRIYGWQFGQDIYTASDIKLRPERILPIDHPYAGWIYAGVFREFSDATGSGSRLGLDIGCLGPCAGGEWTQTQLHRVLKQPLPQGWSTQLHQEWGAVLSGEWSHSRWNLGHNIDLQPRLKGRFGNIFTDVSVDAVLRFGRLSSLPEQAAHFGFLRGELKAIGYDATLQGGYFNNQPLFVHPQGSVGELEFGYQWRSTKYGLNASVIRRSTGIKELSNTLGAQNFVRLQFNYAM